MRVPMTEPLKITPEQRRQLKELLSRPSAAAGLSRRARVVLFAADGLSGGEIAERLGLHQQQVSRIRARFAAEGVNGLHSRTRAGRKDHAVSPEVTEQIVQSALSPPPAGRSRWTTRLLARAIGVAAITVSRILRANDLKPHLVRTYKVSRDPEFAAKVRDIVGLYLNPPMNAVVLSLDEKTGIQALHRTQLPLPLRKGRAVRHTHDYKRHGVVDLYAALDIASGKVTHECRDSHKSADFLSFMKKVERVNRAGELHVILDNSSTHSTPDVTAWLSKNPRVKFHYTPTSASWINQVEGFFGILGKQSLSITDFPSKKMLRKHIDAYIRDWNKHPTPFSWTKPATAIIRSHKRMRARLGININSGTVH